MTRRLKCIGGPADGIFKDVPSSYRQIIIRHSRPPRPWNKTAAPPDFVTYTETLYVIGNVAVGKDVVEFLHPSDWTPLQTLQHVFGA